MEDPTCCVASVTTDHRDVSIAKKKWFTNVYQVLSWYQVWNLHRRAMAITFANTCLSSYHLHIPLRQNTVGECETATASLSGIIQLLQTQRQV